MEDFKLTFNTNISQYHNKESVRIFDPWQNSSQLPNIAYKYWT